MNRHYLHILFALTGLIFLLSCGGGGGGGSSSGASRESSLVSITVGSSGTTASLKTEKNTLYARAKIFFRELVKSKEAIAAIPANVSTITFSISASGMTTITRTVTLSGQTSITETFTVPTGTGRTFIVSALGSSGDLLYRGEAVSDLNGGSISISIPVKTSNAALGDWLLSLRDVLNKKPAMTAADLDPYFSANYGINDGKDRATVINNWLKPNEGPSTDIKKITGFSGVTLLSLGNGLYQAQGIHLWDDGSYGYLELTEEFTIAYEDSVFKFKGNGYWAEVRIQAESHRWDNLTGNWAPWGLASPPGYATGLNIDIEDEANHGLQYATVQGPGLGAGVTLTKQAGKIWFALDPAYRNNGIPTGQSELVTLADVTILSIPPNAAYTVTIMDAATTIVETRTVRLPQRPFTLGELSLAGYFMGLSLINGHVPTAADNVVSAMNIGGTLTFSYSTPTTYSPIWLSSNLNYFDASSNSADGRSDLLLTQSSGSISTTAPAWTPARGHLELEAEDSSNRKVYHHWMFQ